MKLSTITGAVLLCISAVNSAAVANQAITVSYQNTHNSTLELNFSGDDALTGTFTTAVAIKECQDVLGVARPVVGYVLGNAVTFSVDYPTCGSIVTFSGHFNEDKSKIETISMITHQTTAGAIGSQFIANDTFVQKK